MKCYQCRSDIADDATRCRVCGSYAAKWRNELQYWSNATALVVFIGSVLAFVVPYTKKTFFPEDGIEFVELDSDNRIVIRNVSDKPTYLVELLIQTPLDGGGWYRWSTGINETIEPNTHKVVKLDYWTRWAEPGISRVSHATVRGVSDEQWKLIQLEALKGITEHRSRNSGACYEYQYFLTSGPAMTLLKHTLGPTLRVNNDAKAVLIFNSGVTSKYSAITTTLDGVVEETLTDTCPQLMIKAAPKSDAGVAK